MGDCNEVDDQFFDTQEEITSMSDSSSNAGDKSDSESTVGSELVSSFGYEVWIEEPGTILERRQRLLNLMGLCEVQTNEQDPVSDLEGAEVEIDISRITQDSGAVLRSNFADMRFSGQSSEWHCSIDLLEVFVQELEENLVYRIRNLDNGTEFMLDELGQDGILSRIREVGSNRLFTYQEFESILGWSSLVQKVMRKDTAQLPSSFVVKRRAKKGWLKQLGNMACISNVQVGLKNSVAQDGIQTVRVRTFRKRSKELSALYLGQDLVAHNGAILAMKFSPDGQLLASAGEDGIVRVWQVIQTRRPRPFHILGAKSSSVYFMLNDRSELVPLNVDKEKRSKLKGLGKSSESICRVVFPEGVFHIAEKPLHEFQGHHGEVLDLSWSKDKWLLSSSVDKTVCLWRVGSDHCQRIFSHNDYVTCVQFNPGDENYFISGSIDGKVRTWAVGGGAVVDWIDVKGIVTAFSYQPDGKGAIVGSMNGDCFFFDTSDNRLQLVNQMCFQGKKKSPSRRITGLQFSPVDASKLMITSADSHVRILQGGNVICKYRGARLLP